MRKLLWCLLAVVLAAGCKTNKGSNDPANCENCNRSTNGVCSAHDDSPGRR